MRKYRDTRIVKFDQDYAPGGKVIYAKGSTHAIHVETVEKLQLFKVKMTVEKLDPSKIEARKIAEKKKAKELAKV